MQGAEFFTALFGSERFEHLVGELMIAAAARVGGDIGASQLRKLQVLAPIIWSSVFLFWMQPASAQAPKTQSGSTHKLPIFRRKT